MQQEGTIPEKVMEDELKGVNRLHFKQKYKEKDYLE